MPVSGDVANTARSYPNCVFVRSCSPQLYLRRRLPRGITAGFLFTLRSSSLQLLGGDITTWLTPPSPRVSLRPLAGPWPCPSRPRDSRKGPAAVRVPAMEAPSSTLVAGCRSLIMSIVTINAVVNNSCMLFVIAIMNFFLGGHSIMSNCYLEYYSCWWQEFVL